MNKKTAFFKKLDLTLDITIYCIFYVCYLSTTDSALFDLIACLGITSQMLQYNVFFWKIGWFCKQCFYLPALIPIIIVAYCEVYTNFFSSWSVRLIVKCIGAIFFLGVMLALSPFTFMIMIMGPQSWIRLRSLWTPNLERSRRHQNLFHLRRWRFNRRIRRKRHRNQSLRLSTKFGVDNQPLIPENQWQLLLVPKWSSWYTA